MRRPRLLNYVGWPYTGTLTATQVSDALGVIRYVAVEWSEGASADAADPWSVAVAATHTRRATIVGGLRDLDDREVPRPLGLIALGGQVDGFAGFLPGVAEEIALAIEHRLAVYVLGGYGGAADQAARALAGRIAPALTATAFARSAKYANLTAAARARGRVSELGERIRWLSGVLQGGDLRNGLSAEENRELFETMDLGRAIALVRHGLARLKRA